MANLYTVRYANGNVFTSEHFEEVDDHMDEEIRKTHHVDIPWTCGVFTDWEDNRCEVYASEDDMKNKVNKIADLTLLETK